MLVPSPFADLELSTGVDPEEAARRLEAEGANELPVEETDVRMLTFATLILGNLALIFTNRSSLPMYAKDQPWNPALLGLAGVALGSLAATLYIAPVREIFRLARPHPADLAALAVVGLLMVSWVELVKALDRRMPHRAVLR